MLSMRRCTHSSRAVPATPSWVFFSICMQASRCDSDNHQAAHAELQTLKIVILKSMQAGTASMQACSLDSQPCNSKAWPAKC